MSFYGLRISALYLSARRCVSTQESSAGVAAGRCPWRPGCPVPCGRYPPRVCFRFASEARRPPCRRRQSSPPEGGWMKRWGLSPPSACLFTPDCTVPCRRRGGRRCRRSPCRCHWACPPLPSACCTGTGWWNPRCHWSTLSPPRTAPAPPRRSPSGSSPLG